MGTRVTTLAQRDIDPRLVPLEDAADLAARGHRGAFDAIVARTTPKLYRLAARIMGDQGEAEDVLQDAYIRAFDALLAGKFDRRSNLETWLYRIVANGALDALRSRKRRRARYDLDSEGVDEAPQSDGSRLAARAALRELDVMLAELPPDQRTAIVLKEVEGLSSNEVAEVMNCSVGSVEQRLVRARATLRKKSEEQ